MYIYKQFGLANSENKDSLTARYQGQWSAISLAFHYMIMLCFILYPALYHKTSFFTLFRIFLSKKKPRSFVWPAIREVKQTWTTPSQVTASTPPGMAANAYFFYLYLFFCGKWLFIYLEGKSMHCLRGHSDLPFPPGFNYFLTFCKAGPHSSPLFWVWQ